MRYLGDGELINCPKDSEHLEPADRVQEVAKSSDIAKHFQHRLTRYQDLFRLRSYFLHNHTQLVEQSDLFLSDTLTLLDFPAFLYSRQ